jgi:prophage regulatory protein
MEGNAVRPEKNDEFLPATKSLINRKQLLKMVPLSDRTIFDMEKRGEFPRRFALTSRNVAWDLAEIEAWIEARKASGDQAVRPGITPS